MRTPLVVLSCLIFALIGCGRESDKPRTVRLFAAASTRDAVEQIAADYRTATGVVVRCDTAASSTLARQIEHGDDADLFLSADEEWADYLEKKGLVAERRTLLTNKLVVAAPADSTLAVKELGDLAGDRIKRLAIAGEAVPAGRYARRALREAGVWDRVAGRLLEGKDVTAVLLYVARKEADAGLVYATDARGNSRVRITFEIPERLSGPIHYPLVTVRRERANPDMTRFAEYLTGDEAAAVFRKAGFGVVRGGRE